MPRLFPQLASIVFVLLGAATAASAQTVVNFTSLDGTTKLTAHLSRPEGAAPRPAVVHAFDAPDLPRTELPAYRMRDGSIPVIGADREARADAFSRVLEFMKRQLESN
jgi:dienelactone hydrolase